MKRFENIKIGISGIRGIVGDTLNPGNVVSLTRAFATLIRRGRVAVAKDSRLSGDTIKRAVFSGLLFSGITPIDTFTLPTPSLQIYVKEKKWAGGIIITASHNPEQWNGLKFVNSDGLFLFPFTALNLIDLYHQGSFNIPAENLFPGIEEERKAFAVHKNKIMPIIDREHIKKKKFKVLVDPGGGVGAFYDKELLESLGCEVEMINAEMGCTFPRGPEPTEKNLAETSAYMKKGDFDIGFAQDPDADRLSILDETGRAIGGELTLSTALYGYLSKRKSGKIVVNLSTSRVIEDVARKFDIDVVKSPVGEINVVETMIKEKALAGGEGNGGIIIPEVHYCRDSFTGMALVLDLMAGSDKKISQIIDEFPGYKMIKAGMPFSMTGAHKVVTLLKEEYPSANTLDGLRVDEENYWFHIRPSNTEPVLRIVAEGKAGEIENIVDDLKNKIRNMGE